MGGEGTGKNPVDRGKLGWKWSLLTDRQGIPIAWTADGANRHDLMLFSPTLEAAGARGLLGDVETLHLDRGYDNSTVRSLCAANGLSDIVCAKRRANTRPGVRKQRKIVPLGLRWPVERTNSWLSNFGQRWRPIDGVKPGGRGFLGGEVRRRQ
jgi:hypothetical protein